MTPVSISYQALGRLPGYRQILKSLLSAGERYVTATAIAVRARLNEIQVRKDISAVSRRPGKPMVGFSVEELLADIDGVLSYNNVNDAVLVGVGSMGRALLSYPGFADYGMNIVSAFDSDPALAGVRICGREIYPMGEMAHICKRLSIKTGIICVPADAAQSVCDRMAGAGILAIWNFAPTFLRAPDDLLVQNENMLSSLAVLMHRLETAEGDR